MSSLRVDRFGCFGKLPVSREFLVDGARELSESGFDKWVGEGVGTAKARLGPRFDGMIMTFPIYRFTWVGGPSARFLVGQIEPSEDGAGRKHPISVFALPDLRRMLAAGPLMVAGLQPLHDAMSQLLERARQAESPTQVPEAWRGAFMDLEPDGQALRDLYLHFVTARTGADLWASVPGDGSPGYRYQVMQALVETLTPMRGRDPGTYRFGIRFPLSARTPTAAALEVCFWMDLTSRKLGRGLERACCFWSTDSDNGFGPVLYLFFSEPSSAQWMALVDPAAESETISFLDRPYGSQPPEQRMDPALRTILDSPTATLDRYLAWAQGGA